MGLDLEYFKDQKHINDLLKLRDDELSFIIRLLQDDLDETNINIEDGFISKGLIKDCFNASDLFKNFNFILRGYIDVIDENNLSFCDKTETEELINKVDEIKEGLKTILETKIIKSTKKKLDDLLDSCLLNMRVFYDMLSNYTYCETHLWNAYNNREEKINKRERYMEQDKFNTDE